MVSNVEVLNFTINGIPIVKFSHVLGSQIIKVMNSNLASKYNSALFAELYLLLRTNPLNSWPELFFEFDTIFTNKRIPRSGYIPNTSCYFSYMYII